MADDVTGLQVQNAAHMLARAAIAAALIQSKIVDISTGDLAGTASMQRLRTAVDAVIKAIS